MPTTLRRSALALSYVLGALVAAVRAEADVVATRMLEESVAVDAAASLEVVVDNVFGPIRVTVHDASTVEMTATETIRGDTQSDVDRAATEVGLRTVREDGRVAFLVRRLDDDCDCACEWGCRRWEDYVVAYDIELRVPRDAAVHVETVNDGAIVIDGVRGRFDVENVNGSVTLTGLRSAGRATTVNGKMSATFDRAPTEASSFETVNGEIDVTFPSDFSADLELTTMRGEIWTDFEAAPLPSALETEKRTGGGVLIRAERRTRVRIGSGGPTHTFETLNGDIYVRAAD